ncbi:MAG: YigZ family protein [Campylobacterota bacterium]|nr:YigZ family protein [Campylobacterota bacterium]
MKFITEEFSNTYEIKKSKFITHIIPYDQFKIVMDRLKDEHTKARHFVYAYRFINEFDQIVENSSDDGEPKGTSGKPSLSVLSGADIINTAVIIVRYFGGIRLGTGGLVRAYSDAVNKVIRLAQLNDYEKLIYKSLEIKYTDLSKIEYLFSKYKINIIDKLFEQSVTLHLEASNDTFNIVTEILPREYFLKDM